MDFDPEFEDYLTYTLNDFPMENIEEWYRCINREIRNPEQRNIAIQKIELMEKAKFLPKLKEWYCFNYKDKNFWINNLTKKEYRDNTPIYSPKEPKDCIKQIRSLIIRDLILDNFKIYPVGKINPDGSMVFFEPTFVKNPYALLQAVREEYPPTMMGSIMNNLACEFPMSEPADKHLYQELEYKDSRPWWKKIKDLILGK